MLLLIIVLVLEDSVTLPRQCSCSCDGTSIINPCFQALMTALAKITLWVEISHIRSHLRGEILVLNVWQKALYLWLCKSSQMAHGGGSQGTRDLIGMRSRMFGVLIDMVLGIGTPQSLRGPCSGVTMWFCKWPWFLGIEETLLILEAGQWNDSAGKEWFSPYPSRYTMWK